MSVQTIKRRFQVKKLEGQTFKKKFAVYVKKQDDEGNDIGKSLEYVEKDIPMGWMVFFPNGSSIHVETEAEMKRMGYDQEPDLVDIETGDTVPLDLDLEVDVSRRTKPARAASGSTQRKG